MKVDKAWFMARIVTYFLPLEGQWWIELGAVIIFMGCFSKNVSMSNSGGDISNSGSHKSPRKEAYADLSTHSTYSQYAMQPLATSSNVTQARVYVHRDIHTDHARSLAVGRCCCCLSVCHISNSWNHISNSGGHISISGSHMSVTTWAVRTSAEGAEWQPVAVVCLSVCQ